MCKELLEKGHEVSCFEARRSYGGVWRFDPDEPGGVYDHCRMTSSPWVTAFSDYAPSVDTHEAHWSHTR